MTLNITNAGLNVLLRALAGDNIVFTRVQIGNGAVQTAATAEALANPLVDLTITAITVGTTNVTLQTKFSNSLVEAGFRHTETAIWCQNQDDDTQEVLYAYGYQQEATADYISAIGDSILETQMDFLVFVGESQNISAIISESMVYASANDLKAHVENKDNPHEVTKKQVGLEYVPNVPTNNQTPTYTTPANLTALVSGEKLWVALGKVARAVLSLISHLKDNKNPHKIDAKQIGAAAENHSHTATDIQKGTLNVDRGGTGKHSWMVNRLLYPSTTTSFTQLAFPGKNGSFLKQNTSGAPYWGESSETGTYTGQGRTGSSAPNSITFANGTPKAVFVKQKGSSRWGILLLDPSVATGFSVVNGVTSELVVSISGATVSWYYDSTDPHPANQLDHYGKTFAYVGIF